MNSKIVTAVLLTSSLFAFSQVSTAATLKSTSDIKEPISVKSSPIERALQQQRSEGKLRSDNNLKVLTSINAAPSQSFFASQNQRFSRFIQSLFTQSNS